MFTITIHKLFSTISKCIHIILLYYGLPNSPIDVPEIKYSFVQTFRMIKKVLHM